MLGSLQTLHCHGKMKHRRVLKSHGCTMSWRCGLNSVDLCGNLHHMSLGYSLFKSERGDLLGSVALASLVGKRVLSHTKKDTKLTLFKDHDTCHKSYNHCKNIVFLNLSYILKETGMSKSCHDKPKYKFYYDDNFLIWVNLVVILWK